MQEFEEDYYDILGVDEQATPQEIKKAYLKLAKQLHPDRYPNDPDQRRRAQTEFARVTRAHDIVSDEERRTEYDTIRNLKKKREQASIEDTHAQTIVDADRIGKEIYHARGWNTLAMTEVQTSLRTDPRDSEARTLEARIKQSQKAESSGKEKKSFFQQLKEILTKKL